MLTNEDLQAISQLIKNEVEPIKNDIASMKQDISDLKSDVSTLKFDVSVMKQDISTLQSDVAEMKEDIEVIKEDCEITRDGTNHLGEWVEYYFDDVMPYPLDRDKANKEQSILNLINVIEQQKR